MFKKKRIFKSEKIVSQFCHLGDTFHVGLLLEDFLKSPHLEKYNLPRQRLFNRDFTPTAKGAVTRANIHGKYVRAQPEYKIEKRTRIKYTRKDGTPIDYVRIFNVYAKELQHQYHVQLSYKENPHGQIVVVSPPLKYDATPENNRRNTHVINMFYEICGDFEIFTADLEPALKFNKQFEEDLLPQGHLSDPRNFEEVVDIAKKVTKNETEVKAFTERLRVIQEFNPDILGKGPNRFFGYIVFGFTEKNEVILESMYKGNATYVFSIEDYEKKVIINKQDVLNNNLAKQRFFHLDNWEKRIREYLSRSQN